MREGDLEILEEIIQTRGGFGHREHLELAWTCLRLYPLDGAASVMTAAVRHVARRHGAEDKYHETLTRADYAPERRIEALACHSRSCRDRSTLAPLGIQCRRDQNVASRHESRRERGVSS